MEFDSWTLHFEPKKKKKCMFPYNPGACIKHRKFHKKCPPECIHRNSVYLCCKKHKRCSPIECHDFEEFSALILSKLKNHVCN